MQTHELKINELSISAYEWYLGYLCAIDEMNLEAYSKFLAHDSIFQFGNNPIVYGKDAILQSLGYFWSSINGIEHILKNIYGNDNTFVLEALNKYTRKDGKEVVIPAVAITDRNQAGLVTSMRIYTDTAPVFA
ncbi:MAG: hypothetical protein DSM106950_24120 [Stigonema ocellatum SAG 48.90 = DSM 106950]|nr:hypothetical protein [Stigonema ocellatum SAG 48.90 = DSM 106950]